LDRRLGGPQNRSGREVIIIIMTTNNAVDDITEAILYKVLAYRLKPICTFYSLFKFIS
jgi:hypothetical protein